MSDRWSFTIQVIMRLLGFACFNQINLGYSYSPNLRQAKHQINDGKNPSEAFIHFVFVSFPSIRTGESYLTSADLFLNIVAVIELCDPAYLLSFKRDLLIWFNTITIFYNKHIKAINETKQNLVNDQQKLNMHFF